MKKKLLISSVVIIVLLGGAFLIRSNANRESTLAQTTVSHAESDTVIELLLLPEIQKDVNRFYEPYFISPPNIGPVSMDILGISQASSGYDVTLQLYPYLGAHNSVGKDVVTLNVGVGSVTTKEFRHVKSSEVPDWLKDDVIQWPP